MIMERTYEYILKLPNFRGKARIDEALRHFLRPKASRIIHDIAMELDPEEWLQIDLRKFGRLEPKTTAAFERILKHGGICVDVGAISAIMQCWPATWSEPADKCSRLIPSPTIATGCSSMQV